MNLLIFIHSLHSGGAERVAVTLANHWVQKGWQVTVVTLTSSNLDFYKLHPGVQRIGLNVAKGSSNIISAISNNIRRIHALRIVLKKNMPDVALAMMSTSNILLAFASIGLKSIVTIGSERTYPGLRSLGAIWDPLRFYFYGYLRAMVALTGESKKWLEQYTKISKVQVIPNPVLWPIPVNTPILPVIERSKNNKVLLSVGRLSQEKGFLLLIDVFLKIAPDFKDWKLVILGDGPDRSVLNAKIEAAKLGHQIILPGRAGNVGDWYSVADLYVLSSKIEGFPNTLIEAMSHGLPVVSFDCDTGPRDIIRNEVDGVLVPAADAIALEMALRRLMSNQILRNQLAANAIDVRERFSLNKIIEKWENLFEELKIDK